MSGGFWPHQFTKTEAAHQIGEDHIADNTVVPRMAQPMECVHCHLKYLQNVDAFPQGACPARSDKREMKRIKNG